MKEEWELGQEDVLRKMAQPWEENAKDGVKVAVGKAQLTIRTTAPTGDVAQQVMEARAEAFLQGIEEGMTKAEAAEAAGASLAELKRDPVVLALAKDLIRKYRMTAAERKELVRSKLNQVLLEGEDKYALQAAKMIGEDVEVGLTRGGGSVSVNVEVFGKEAQAALTNLEELEGWGEVIDAEVEKE